MADAFSLLERFEAKLEKYSGSLKRAAVSLAQEWRTDKVMRQLNAMLIVADKEELLIVSGTGEVIDPDDGIAAIGRRHVRAERGKGAEGKYGSERGGNSHQGNKDSK